MPILDRATVKKAEQGPQGKVRRGAVKAVAVQERWKGRVAVVSILGFERMMQPGVECSPPALRLFH